MYNFMQGYQPFIIQFWSDGQIMLNSAGEPYELIFPRTNSAGFKEYHKPESITQKDIGGDKDNILLGYDTSYVANFSRYTKPVALKHTKLISDKWINKKLISNFELILIPRRELREVKFSVFPSDKTLEIGIMRGGNKAPGNTGLVLEFIVKKMLTSLPINDPNDINFGFTNLNFA